ncbi:hypothetical protein DL770_001216 [Monosporascus sp. CRB-9-2]|nr:hypothetical protein DL770_001216 [Monosporascus sp. CRB-9-2]
MDSHKSNYDSSSEAPVVKEDLQGLIDDVVTSHTRSHNEETTTEQQNPGNHPLGAAAITATQTHTHTEHETALSREVEDILQGLIDVAIASAYENERGEPVPGGGGGGQQSALAALLARMTSQQRGGGNRAAPPPGVIVISSDSESSSDDEPFPRFLMRCSSKRSQGSVPLPGTRTAATDTAGFPSSSSSPAGSSRTSTIRCDDPDANAGRQESIVAKIQRRPAVEFPRHAYGRRQKRRYETSSDDDEGAGRRGGRRRRRRSGRAEEQAQIFIDLTLDSKPEEPPHAEASSPPAAPDRPPKEKKKQKQKQKHEGNDKQKRRPEPPAGKRNRIGQMAAAAAAARSGKRWKY